MAAPPRRAGDHHARRASSETQNLLKTAMERFESQIDVVTGGHVMLSEKIDRPACDLRYEKKQGGLLRNEMSAADDRLRLRMKEQGELLHVEMRARDAALREEIRAVDTAFRHEIKAVETGLREELATSPAEVRAELADVGAVTERSYAEIDASAERLERRTAS